MRIAADKYTNCGQHAAGVLFVALRRCGRCSVIFTTYLSPLSLPSMMVVVLILMIAVGNLALGFALSAWRMRTFPVNSCGTSVIPAVRPVETEPADQRVAAPADSPLPLPKASNAGERLHGLPQSWLNLLQDVAQVNSFMEAAIHVLRLKVGAYRDRLADLDGRVRGCLQKSPGPDISSILAEVAAANREWLGQAREATDHLCARRGSLGDLESVASDLEQVLLEQAAQVETTCSNLEILDFQSDPFQAGKRLLRELGRLLDLCHRLRDAMQTSFVAVMQQEQRLRQLDPRSLVDGLTGLHNQAGLQNFLDDFRLSQLAQPRSACLAWIAIDQLAAINERFGPRLGDQLIAAVADVISETLRTDRGADLACRVLGNGFAAFLGDTRLPDAGSPVERIRQSVAKATFEAANERLAVTVRCGLVDIDSRESLSDMISRAQAVSCGNPGDRGDRTWIDQGNGPQRVEPPQLKVPVRSFNLSA